MQVLALQVMVEQITEAVAEELVVIENLEQHQILIQLVL